MPTKIKYKEDGMVILGGREWDWDNLKELCYSDFVYEQRNRGTICNKYKLPTQILNDWIAIEEWETARKSHWQRPISYRIDTDLSNLIQNILKLNEIQKEVHDIDFKPNNLLSRITIKIDIRKDNHQVKNLKTITLEKYKVIFTDEIDDFGLKASRDMDEIRYKSDVQSDDVIIKFSKLVKKRNEKAI